MFIRPQPKEFRDNSALAPWKRLKPTWPRASLATSRAVFNVSSSVNERDKMGQFPSQEYQNKLRGFGVQRTAQSALCLVIEKVVEKAAGSRSAR
jgi:hypothetical protein